MNLYITDPNGDLVLQNGSRIVVEFDDGKTLELTDSPQPLPAEIPEGIHLWGGRMPSETDYTGCSQLNMIPVAANGMIISPRHENIIASGEITLFIADAEGALRPMKENKLLIELSNGKTLEIMADYGKKGLLIWGGREPIAGLPLEELQKRTESLGIYPLASNVVHLFPYQLV